MRYLAWLTPILFAAACRGPAAVMLTSDNGRDSASFSCRAPVEEINQRAEHVLGDYSLRLAREAAAAGDTLGLRQLTGLYERGEWRSLAGIAVTQACRNGALPVPVLTFPAPRSAAPPFALPTVQGTDTVRLTELQGKLVLIDFWGTWCGPCVQQMPEVVALANEFPGRLTVVAILSHDTPERARTWLAAHPPGHVIHLSDPGGRAATQYGIRGVPWSYVLDEQGRVLASMDNPHVRMRMRQLRQYLRNANQPDA